MIFSNVKGFDAAPCFICKRQLALSIGVHIEAKKLLKMFAFLQKLETNLPSTRRNGIVGSFLL